VQWVPGRRIVVVRYLAVPAPTPPPTSSPTTAPVAAPPVAATPAPTPTPGPKSYHAFLEGAFAAPATYNELSAGQWCKQSFFLGAGYMFENSPLAIKVDYRQDVFVTSDDLTDRYGNHFTRFETIDGGISYTPVFRARQISLDERLEYRIAAAPLYIGASYIEASNNYGYPQPSGLGFGLEKMPALRSGVDFVGSAFYYPSVSGNYTVTGPSSSNLGVTYRQQYQTLKFDAGISLGLARFPVYLYGGFNGDRFIAKQNAPIAQTHDGPYVGLGVKF
jgi:hypothetical protein